MTLSYPVRKGKTGVYAIWHAPTDLTYVGASGYCIYNRFRHHFVMLRKGTHATPKLQKLWNQNNGEMWGFYMLVLELCPKELCREREQFHMREIPEGYLLNGSPDAARKRWSNPEYRASVTEKVREITTRRWAEGSFTGTRGMKLPHRRPSE